MATDTSLNHEQKGLSDFLASHGGPFYELQARLNLFAGPLDAQTFVDAG